MVYIANLAGTKLSPVYLAQLALKYNVPAVAGAPRPSEVPALQPYVAPQPQPQTFILPPAPQPPPPPPVTSIIPPAPLPNKPEVVGGGGGAALPEVADTGHACTRCGGGSSGSSTPALREQTLGLTVAKPATPAATPLPATTSGKVPSWLGTVLTVGGAFLSMRGIK